MKNNREINRNYGNYGKWKKLEGIGGSEKSRLVLRDGKKKREVERKS